MKRSLMAIAAFGSLCAPGLAADAPADKPNVLFICVDDLKPLLGCYGDSRVKTPNLDRLAARGVVFNRAFCNQAVCAPSRNSLLTGLRPQSIGVYDLGTNFRKSVPDAVTMPQYFRRNGYRTEALGKILHIYHGNSEDPVSWTVPHWMPKGSGYLLPENQNLVKQEAVAAKAAKRAPKVGAPTECADVADNAYNDGLIADEAVRRLRAAKDKPGQPWFIAVGFLKPHLPFCAPKKYWDLYKAGDFPLPAVKELPAGAPKFAGHTSGELRNFNDIPDVGPLNEAQTRNLIHGYYAAVSYMDAQLGRVLDALDETGLSRNTIIVMWGDHGWHLGDHGLWCKQTNYEQAARIPLIVAAPGMAKNARSGSLVETVDLYPTLCELAGLSAPRGLDGSSFAAVMKTPDAPTKAAVFHVYPRKDFFGRAVRTERYRLVEWKKFSDPAGKAVYELYDYEADPDETKNLYSAQPDVAAQLIAILAKQPEAKPQVKIEVNAGKAKQGTPAK